MWINNSRVYRCVMIMGILLTGIRGYGQAVQAVALVTDHLAAPERTVLETILKQDKGCRIVPVTLQALSKADLAVFKCIWYHRTDTTQPDDVEQGMGAKLVAWVEKGGNLFLSMEGMPLLNTWSLEPVVVGLQRDTIRDEGFGRPLGFHAFKSHPLFDGLQGGVYVSKQPEDHVVRKHGFFGQAVPVKARVAGIDWTYITFTENNKLLVEIERGKGKVVAAGAYLYYTVKNHHRQHLETFTMNVLKYLTGRPGVSKARYWQYDPLSSKKAVFALQPLQPAGATAWQLPRPSLAIPVVQPGKEFYDLAGRRMLWMGQLKSGMEELWIHPYMALRDLEAGLQLPGTDSVTWLKHLAPAVTVTPEYLERRYHIGAITLKEVYTVSFDQPYGVAHYEMEGSGRLDLSIRFATNLRFMWPYSPAATGSIQYGFQSSVNGHLFSGQGGELNTAVLYSSRPVKEESYSVPEKQEVRAAAVLTLSARQAVNVYISGSAGSMQEALQPLRQPAHRLNNLFIQSNTYYGNLLSGHLYFETPDSLFNEGYRWANE